MGRPTRTKSRALGGQRQSREMGHKAGEDWRSQREGEVDIKKVGPWIEDMEEWSEMMHEALMELREDQACTSVRSSPN